MTPAQELRLRAWVQRMRWRMPPDVRNDSAAARAFCEAHIAELIASDEDVARALVADWLRFLLPPDDVARLLQLGITNADAFWQEVEQLLRPN